MMVLLPLWLLQMQRLWLCYEVRGRVVVRDSGILCILAFSINYAIKWVWFVGWGF